MTATRGRMTRSYLEDAHNEAKQIPEDSVAMTSHAQACVAYALLHISEQMERLIRATQQRTP